MTLCPVCLKPIAVSPVRNSVFYHLDGIGKPCYMNGHRLIDPYMSDPTESL